MIGKNSLRRIESHRFDMGSGTELGPRGEAETEDPGRARAGLTEALGVEGEALGQIIQSPSEGALELVDKYAGSRVQGNRVPVQVSSPGHCA